MKRTQIYLTKRQLGIIKESAYKIGISKSEFIRRILDQYIDNQKLDLISVRKGDYK